MSVGEQKFDVFKDHLKRAGDHLHKAAVNYQRYVPNGGRFNRASGGSPQLDKVLDVTLSTIEEMHTILVQALDQHGAKLIRMYNRYEHADASSITSIAAALQDLMAPPDAPPPLDAPPKF